MLLMLTYAVKDLSLRDKAIERFKATGGLPPNGVTFLGRWHKASMNEGYVLVECSNATALAAFAHNWSDVLHMEAVPVIEDSEAGKVFAGQV